ncbi:hypothetical protein COV24_01125 [candidate division WWE3 bacterium CG10_big_fil_rev_8_21_14_0_10_32_10]|uniref:Exonuclease domain-containing protein n=1 Tax=candidate division WWE3 bacterium CG10_big_fil_rev_8_21_14_0_10_32_10 TaxID=1975090 RepID=A0A2H0RB32_UNCKA|nr:MAG: hypothetical protein COV24_01125 [candidate division WWE3 bacterium CG10_big_fil_rev_8_21_14_0_10_32_10]
MSNKIYSIVDTETTGLNPRWGRVIDIAVVSVKEGKVINKYETLVNPGQNISKFISSYTGINNKLVKKAPEFIDISYNLKDLLDNTIVIAHNAMFDISFLKNEFKRVNLDWHTEYMCTINLCRKLYPTIKKRDLDTLAKNFNVKIENRHRALGDALATARIFTKMYIENNPIWEYTHQLLKRV